MPWQDHVHFYLDSSTYGGVLYERVLAAIVLAEGIYCGLVFSFPTAGKPTIEFWERIDDLERGGFAPIRPERARAISDALPRFLEQLERAEQVAQNHKKQASKEGAAKRAQQRWSAHDHDHGHGHDRGPQSHDRGAALPPEMESRPRRQKGSATDPDAYEGG